MEIKVERNKINIENKNGGEKVWRYIVKIEGEWDMMNMEKLKNRKNVRNGEGIEMVMGKE